MSAARDTPSVPPRAVWKFPLAVTDEQTVEMPYESRILCVQSQAEQPCIWALVDPHTKKRTRRKFLIAGTGHERSDLYGLVTYVDTFQLRGGALVFHVFEDMFGQEQLPG